MCMSMFILGLEAKIFAISLMGQVFQHLHAFVWLPYMQNSNQVFTVAIT